MKKKKKLFPVILIVLLVLTVVTAALFFVLRDKRKQPIGTYMDSVNAAILLKEAGIPFEKDEEILYKTLKGVMQPSALKMQYEAIYKDDFLLLEEDWYAIFDEILKEKELDGELFKETGTLFDCNEEGFLYYSDGKYEYLATENESFFDALFSNLNVYRTKEKLVTIREVTDNHIEIPYVFLAENNEDSCSFIMDGYYVHCNKDTFSNDGKDSTKVNQCVASLQFADGILRAIQTFGEPLSGEALLLSDVLEIRNSGVYSLAPLYKIYDVRQMNAEETESACMGNPMEVGIGDSNFEAYLDDGLVCGIVILRDASPKKIRVAISNNGMESRAHEMISVSATAPFCVTYGPWDCRICEDYSQNDILDLKPSDEWFENHGRVEITCDTGLLTIKSIERNRGIPNYRGSFEIIEKDGSLYIVNELNPEKYLLNVIPSEMPASYPMEALKAQTIAARNYAMMHMKEAGLPDIGAHLDDSARFQVYNNLNAYDSTTLAVEETNGMILLTPEKSLAETYYYSTSPGYSVSTAIWNREEELPYLVAAGIDDGSDNNKPSAKEVQDSEIFDSFIRNTWEGDYEVNEGFYRWNLTIEDVDTEFMYARLKDLYETNNSRVEIKNADGEFESGLPKEFQKVINIEPLSRREGGTLYEILITTDEEVIRVNGENNCGYVLTDGKSKCVLQGGGKYGAEKYLPSPWWSIEVEREDGIVVGYKIIGGGFGHGIGLSQNGAKCMANAGMNCKEILEFFYKDCSVE